MKNDIEVTIAIVNYKTPELLRNCLKSIYKHTKNISFEIFVVDNASGDGSAGIVKNEFPEVELIANKKNLYASAGFNQILKKAESPFCLITEPGVELHNNALKQMLSFLKNHKKAAACSCRQIDENGNVDSTCSRFPTPFIEFFNSSVLSRVVKNEKLLSWYRYGKWERDSIRRVDVVSDIFMLIRTDVLRQVDYYDPQMDLFFIENDLCLKIKKAGYYVYHLGNVTVRHLRGMSTAKFKGSEMYNFYEHDLLYYYKKHFGLFAYLFLWTIYRFDWFFWKLKSF